MSSPRLFHTQTGRPVVLGRMMGKGGEGVVHAVQSDATIAAKVYHADKAAERRQKIEAIVAAQWHKTAACVAFPIDLLLGVIKSVRWLHNAACF